MPAAGENDSKCPNRRTVPVGDEYGVHRRTLTRGNDLLMCCSGSKD